MTDHTVPEPLLMTTREAARALAVSARTLWTLTKAGALPAVRIGRSVRYAVDDVQAFIRCRRRAAESKRVD